MSDFIRIKREDVPTTITGKGQPLSERTEALLAGETIFIPGRSSSWRPNLGVTLRKRGFSLHGRAMVHDGVEGSAAWAEKIEP